MRLHKANYGHLYQAALYLAPSDREEMDRVKPGRCPVEVLTASSNDPTIRAITDDRGNVLAVGGTPGTCIWFVHTSHAEALDAQGKLRMFHMLKAYLAEVKAEAKARYRFFPLHFTNVVSVENLQHIKLLTALGATWGDTKRALDDCQFRQFYF